MRRRDADIGRTNGGSGASGSTEASRHRELIDQVVHLVARVSLDPLENHVPTLVHSSDEGLPKVAIRDGLLLRVGPSPLYPPGPPTVAETIDDVCRVTHDDQRPGE